VLHKNGSLSPLRKPFGLFAFDLPLMLERQWREHSVVMGRITLSLAQGF